MTLSNRHTEPSDTLSNGALRAMRARTRQRFRNPRPLVLPEIKTRVGLWKARVEAAQKAGLISKGCHLYAFNLLTVPSVIRGQWCLYGDPGMGERINCSGKTVQRHRKQLVDAGLVQSIDGKKRGTTCMVRPILADGAVYELPKKPDIPDSSVRGGRTELSDDLLLTRTKKERGKPENEASKTTGQPLVAADVVSSPQPEPPPLPPEKALGNGEVAEPPEPNTANRPCRVQAESQPGMAWLRHWSKHRERGLPVDKFGYFTRALPSEWPPQ
jgi:hypothetical protein